ncbi:MAG: hypothetical protein ABGW87_03475 [Sphingomonadaceae bacterium]
MEEGSENQTIKRIEAALARIDRASERLAAASGATHTLGMQQDAAMRSKVEQALSELDALIGELEK